MGRVGPLVVMGALWMVGCSEVRQPVEESRECETTWRQDVRPVVAERCASCHSGALPAGQYSLESYLSAVGTGSDATPNVVEGDASSRILTALDPGAVTAHANVPELEQTRELLRQWVVDCDASINDSDVHEGGILNPHSEDWHGRLVMETYQGDLTACVQCHGDDFSGGPAGAGATCLQCHTGEAGPGNCSTCHEMPPTTGAHPGHFKTLITSKDETTTPDELRAWCSECHLVPERWDDEGHVRRGNKADPAPSEIRFGNIARADPHGTRSAAPEYDAASKSCSNVYCHGGAFADTGFGTTPTWESGPLANGCQSCHQMPPLDHQQRNWTQYECSNCHWAVVTPDHEWADTEKHVDGQINVGAVTFGNEQCNSCHGDATSIAPPRDLTGDTATTSLGVGAHRAHVSGTRGLSNPISCVDCHPAVESFQDPDHLDGAPNAEVFPADGLARRATADSAAAVWNRTTATCTNYCHGGGAKMASDTATTLIRNPQWTAVNQGQTVCGTCHGVPPNDPVHRLAADTQPFPITLSNCYRCHAESVNPGGAIRFTGEGESRTTTHLNGEYDVDYAQ